MPLRIAVTCATCHSGKWQQETYTHVSTVLVSFTQEIMPLRITVACAT